MSKNINSGKQAFKNFYGAFRAAFGENTTESKMRKLLAIWDNKELVKAADYAYYNKPQAQECSPAVKKWRESQIQKLCFEIFENLDLSLSAD